MMEETITGMLARSKAGHDKDHLYLIVAAKGEYVYLADGRIKMLEKPKKKKQKHIQLIKEKKEIKDLSNEKIKRILKLWRREEA